MSRQTDAERRWLVDNYARGSIHDTIDAFEAEFGWRPTRQTIYQRAHKLGLRKMLQDPRIRTDKAVTRVVWSHEPKMEAWMLEHDTGAMQDTIERFEDEFGFRLTRGQVSRFRSSHGTQKRDKDIPRRGGKPRRPVGFERKTKGGILVKVAEEATVAQSKDNWRYKHHIAYEKAYGPIPEGHQICFVDGDDENCDPANLLAVPKRAIGAINNARSNGGGWSDRESMQAVVNMACLKVKINDAEHRQKRACEVCGKRFTEPDGNRRRKSRAKTCPECLKAGRKARGDRRARKGPAVKRCKVCGASFEPWTSRQVRCFECIRKAPKVSASRQMKGRKI